MLKYFNGTEWDYVPTKNYGTDSDLVGASRFSTIVIANYDSHKNSKKGADIVIEKGENAAKKINEAIQSLRGTGGEVRLMEGEYNLEYGIVVDVPNVHLTGVPGATVLKQSTDWTNNPINNSNPIIETLGLGVNDSVHISNLLLEGAKLPSSIGLSCHGLARVSDCIVSNIGGTSFVCSGSSQVTNCTSINTKFNGFVCFGSSQVTNCTSINTKFNGFQCTDSSQVTNCTSINSGTGGIRCDYSFNGICSFNILKGDDLKDNSSASAVVEYNIIQEEVE